VPDYKGLFIAAVGFVPAIGSAVHVVMKALPFLLLAIQSVSAIGVLYETRYRAMNEQTLKAFTTGQIPDDSVVRVAAGVGEWTNYRYVVRPMGHIVHITGVRIQPSRQAAEEALRDLKALVESHVGG